jgi:protein-tyrosine phosphatase
MDAPAFVDCHSHAVPSGDDGAQSLAEGEALCADAAVHGTAVLFATPHVWPRLTLTPARLRAVQQAYAVLHGRASLDLRLGFELTPTRALLADDLRRYVLGGTECVLLDTPFVGSLDLLAALADRARAQGLRPILAHPERSEAVQDDPASARDLAGRGWLLQVNASSLLGRHGEGAETLGWRLVSSGLAALVASDGHRLTRPARLDEAFAAVKARMGEGAGRLFDGSALGVLALSEEPTRSRAASTGA